MGDVDLCGALGDAEYVGDGLRGEALGGELRDLALAGTERLPEARKSGTVSASAASSQLLATARSIEERSFSSTTGFVRKSTAPRLIALTAISMSPWALTKMTGRRFASSMSFWCSSMPVMPVMRTSKTPQPGTVGSSSSRKASALG